MTLFSMIIVLFFLFTVMPLTYKADYENNKSNLNHSIE